MAGWISVDDALPDANVRVMIGRPKGGLEVSIGIFDGTDWYEQFAAFPTATSVRWWMPLPELPYESKEQNDQHNT